MLRRKKTVSILKIIVFPFTGSGLRLSLLNSLNKLQLLVALMATVRHTFRDKCSLFQAEYVGCNFGAAVPRK